MSATKTKSEFRSHPIAGNRCYSGHGKDADGNSPSISVSFEGEMLFTIEAFHFVMVRQLPDGSWRLTFEGGVYGIAVPADLSLDYFGSSDGIATA